MTISMHCAVTVSDRVNTAPSTHSLLNKHAMLVAAVLLLALAGVPASTSYTTTTPTPVLTWFVDGARGSDDIVLPHNMDGRRVQSPFRTLIRARDAVRQWHALHKHRLGSLPTPQVVVRGGVYPALSLTSADAGVRWSAWPGETPILSAGFRIPPETLSVRSNPQRPAGPPVLHVNLKQFGLAVADFGVLHGESDSSIAGCSETGKMDVYLDNAPLLLARYPDPFVNGTWQWMYVNGTATPPTKGTTPGSSTDFVWRGADTARISTWTTEKDPWLQGYFQFDWTDTIARIAALTTANHTVHIDPSTPTYGTGEPIRAGARWLGLNLLSELDSAGEYYINRETGDLYLIPPSGDSKHGLPPTANLVVSVNQTVLNATAVSNLHFAGFTFMHAQGTGVVFAAGSNITLINCTVANHGTMGIAADGVGYTIESSEVRNTGCAGVNIRSGDRATLTPGRSRIVGNSIHSYGQWKRMYQPGISFDAVGDVYANNAIFQAPHSGMLGHGNDCTFEGNNFTELCTER
jgi:hypothetical protein